MAQAMIFHYRESNNILTSLNPVTKLVFLLSYSIIVSSGTPEFILPFSLVPLVIAFAVRLPFSQYMKESIFFFILAFLMALSSYVSTGDVLIAASTAFAFIAMILSSMLLTDSTMPDELARSLGGVLSKVIGRYAYFFATVVEITLSMIPIIIDSAVGIFDARRARGASFFSHPVKTVSELSVSILSSLLDKAEIYIDALYSRGYDASVVRERAGYRVRDLIIIALSISALLIKKIF